MINSALRAFWKEEDGQDMVEYSLLLAFIALAAVALLTGVKTKLNVLWTTVNATISNAAVAAS
jgi:Flp pilus assembly pilin Flp